MASHVIESASLVGRRHEVIHGATAEGVFITRLTCRLGRVG